MYAYEVTGYAHSSGTIFCCEHAQYGKMEDENNETGKVCPIFASSEYHEKPVCDICNEEIEVSVIEMNTHALETVTSEELEDWTRLKISNRVALYREVLENYSVYHVVVGKAVIARATHYKIALAMWIAASDLQMTGEL